MHGHAAGDASPRHLYTFSTEFFEVKVHFQATPIDYQQVNAKKGS